MGYISQIKLPGGTTYDLKGVASDVYSWAKASTKPSYTASEVGAAASSHTHDYLPLSGGTVTGTLIFSGGTGFDSVSIDSSEGIKLFSLTTDSSGGGTTTIKFDGITTTGTFKGNGSQVTNLNATYLSSGTVPIARIPTGTSSTTVALGNHTHSQYLPLSGGTLTGTLAMDSGYGITFKNIVDGNSNVTLKRSGNEGTYGLALAVTDSSNNTNLYTLVGGDGSRNFVYPSEISNIGTTYSSSTSTSQSAAASTWLKTNSKITLPAGKYIVSASVTFASAKGGRRYVSIYSGDTNASQTWQSIAANTDTAAGYSLSTTWVCVPSSSTVYAVGAYQSTSAAVNVTSSHIIAIRIK
jgi:hypothetical protein